MVRVPEFRLPKALRLYIVVFGLFWCGTLLVSFIRTATNGSRGVIPLLALMLAYGVFFMARMHGLAVVPSHDELVVRNMFKTRTIPKPAIEGFRLGSPAMMPFGKTIHVLLADDTILTADVFIYSFGPEAGNASSNSSSDSGPG